MAKVMVSLPDDLLRALDVEAERVGTTRSGLLRDLAERRLREGSGRRAARIVSLREGVVGHGGNVAELVKRTRPN